MTTIKADPNPPAYPEWDDLTRREHDEHRAECPDGCRFCDGHRAWGECSRCGAEPKEADDEGLSICCGSEVILHSPSEDNLAALRAA